MKYFSFEYLFLRRQVEILTAVEIYRVANIRYKDYTLSGIGAEKVGGRWNRPGTRAVYCSENISLALLEYYVHSRDNHFLPKEILIAKIQFPDHFIINSIKELPHDWNNYPYADSTTRLFSELVLSSDFFALKVPSVIVPLEFNFVLNPLYQNFGRVKIMDFITLNIDTRLS